MKYLVKFVFGCLISLSVLACGSQNVETKEQSAEVLEAEVTEIDYASAEYASAYICPMHCNGSGSAEVGKCPGCGMDYVINADKDKSGGEANDHDHDHDHNDHN
jgi:hypothetical protein